MADVVLVNVFEGRKALAEDHAGASFRQLLVLDDVIEKFAAFAHAVHQQLYIRGTYSVTRKQMSFHSQMSCSLMMLGWSRVLRILISFINVS